VETKNTRKFSSKKITGQGMSEYLVIVGLLAVAGIAAMGFMGGSLRTTMAAFASEMAGGDAETIRGEADTLSGTARDNATSSLTNYAGNNDALDN